MYSRYREMYMMRRTQIYLDPDLSEALDDLARKRGTSRAALIRLAARRFIQAEGLAEDPIFGLVGLARGGPGRASEEHDRILAANAGPAK